MDRPAPPPPKAPSPWTHVKPTTAWEKQFVMVCVSAAVVTLLSLWVFDIPAPTLTDPWWQGLLVIGVTALTQVVAAWAAFSPGPQAIRIVAVVLALLGMEMVIAIRPADTGIPWTRGAWFCSVAEIVFALVPLGTAFFLRRHAPKDLLRAVVLGLGAGAVGATALEVLCTRPRLHVGVFHVGFWVLVTAGAAAYEWFRPRIGQAPTA